MLVYQIGLAVGGSVLEAVCGHFFGKAEKELIHVKIIEALCLSNRGVVSFVGGGGKTSLMFRLNGEIPLSRRVVITTTTKIYMPAADKYPAVMLSGKRPVKKTLQNILQSGARPVLGQRLLPDNKVDSQRRELDLG